METANFFRPLLNPTFQINLKRGGTTFNEFDDDAKAHQYSPVKDSASLGSYLTVFLLAKEKPFALLSDLHS